MRKYLTKMWKYGILGMASFILIAVIALPVQAAWVTTEDNQKMYTAADTKTGYYTGWKKINKKYYFFDRHGYMKTGWFKVKGRWFYCDKKGVRKYQHEDLRLLAGITYFEAGCEPYEGKLAVANVVLNRVKSKKFPNTLEDVIYQSGQFTPALNGTLTRLWKSKKKIQPECIKAAQEAMAGNNNVRDYYYFGCGQGSLKIGAHHFKKNY